MHPAAMRCSPLLPLVLLPALAGCPSANDDDAGPTCAEQAAAAGSWELDPDGEDGQIHPRTVLADEVLWSAWNRPDGSSNFAVFLAGRGCDGSLLVGPIRLDTGDGNATDPDLAVNDDRILVAWQTDDGGAPYNLSVRTAVVSTDGEVVAPDTRAAFLVGGVAEPGQSWMARVAAVDDAFLLVAVRAGEQESFHVEAQPLDPGGAPVGDAISLTDPAEEAFEPAVAVDRGEVTIAWHESFDGSAGFGAATLDGDVPAGLAWPMLDEAGIGAGLTVAGGQIWGVVGTASGALAGPVGTAGERLGDAAALAPGIAGRGDGVVVAWAEGTPVNATWWVRAAGAALGQPIEVGPGAAYNADVVLIDEGHALLTRAVGSSPELRLEADVVALD